MEKTKVRMGLAARIEDLMIEKGWNKKTFAAIVKKSPSELSKWFSGNQNFTIEILTEIAFALEVDIKDLFYEDKDPMVYQENIALKSAKSKNNFNIYTPTNKVLVNPPNTIAGSAKTKTAHPKV